MVRFVLESGNGTVDRFSLRYCNQFGNTLAEVLTVGHDIHRLRRASVNPYFSKQKILSLEPVIQKLVNKLVNRFEKLKGMSEPLPIRLAYECLTTDIITEYCMSKSYGHLEADDWCPKYHAMITKLGALAYLSKQLTFIHPIIASLPSWLVLKMDPGMGSYVEFQEVCLTYPHEWSCYTYPPQDCVKEVSKIQQQKLKPDSEKSHKTVFHEIMYSSDLPPSEKSLYRMRCEAVQFVSAGTDTVSNTMHVMTYHLIDNPHILKRLREEIRTVQPNPTQPAPLKQLEQLPYLTSVILEALRLGYGLATRSPRAAPDRVIIYKDWKIPPGTAVSMTSILIHQNEEIFPEPEKFDPERWTDPAERQRLDKYMVAFSKGTRLCLGIK